MRSLPVLAVVVALLFSCDDQRVFERNADFTSRNWQVTEKPEFEFTITDSLATYNLYCNLRNSLDYPYARIFITWRLQDSTGTLLEKGLARHMLFDEKTGKPFGDSGLGDIYDHRIPIGQNHQFPYNGKFKVSFEQYMRTDTLAGILAVGLRLEKSVQDQR